MATIYKSRKMELILEQTILPNGKKVSIEKVKRPDAVVILALNNDKIIIEKQYRPVIKKWIYELPAGMVEKGEKPAEAAKRELAEEVGYTGKFYYVSSVFVAPGYNTEKMHIFIAKNLKKVKKHLDEDEIIESVEVPVQEALGMIKRKKIIDMKSILTLLLATSPDFANFNSIGGKSPCESVGMKAKKCL